MPEPTPTDAAPAQAPSQLGGFSAVVTLAAPQPALSAGWVSLPGALPKPGTPVLLDIGEKYPIRAQWVPKDSLEATGDGDFGEYNEASDMYYWPEGWYEWNQYEETHWRVDETPRAWQPLPAPQQEVPDNHHRALAAPAQSGLKDAYVGAREDLSIWKRRALEAEATVRNFVREANSPTFMGDPR